ncbi:Methyltransferase-like protein 16 [Mizuhopecten yessoensis]|uniref:Methyltransferase-like protein 16 n=2 Tax=Mizuhopecten yessoensis TaxID=6573 RepID=A0A210QCT0_MIZYE|nr:Methyltransferase-like protein 16 [Mizuhopecten yessoensis]
MYTLKNIETNGMKERITVKKVSVDDRSVLCNLLKDETDTFDFCMCNPPFFADHVEAQAVAKSRNYSRTDPKSVCTASFTESIVEGGEVNFVKRMIKDSMELGTKIRIYSSMIGKKSSLPPLKEELRRLEVPKFSTTEFCQGKTMRWGLAWTFDKTVNFPKSLFQESKKERPKLVYQVPRAVTDLDYNVTHITTRIQAQLTELKIQYNITLNQKSLVTMALVAKENTWSNQRRKRREKLQQKAKEQKDCSGDVDILDEKLNDESGDASRQMQEKSQCEEIHHSDAAMKPQTISCGRVIEVSKGIPFKVSREDVEKESPCGEKTNKKQDAQNLCAESEYKKESVTQSSNSTQSQFEDSILGKDNRPSAEKGRKRKLPDQKSETTEKTLEPIAKRQMLTSETGDSQEINMTSDLLTSSTNKAESTLPDKNSAEEMVNGYSELFGDSTEEKIFLKCLLKVKLSTPHVVMEMTWVEGQKRETMHQVLQYLKNKLSTDVTPVLQ